MKPVLNIHLAAALAALVCIGIGSGAIWGWPTALLIVGALVWVDLFFAGREQARQSALRTIPE